MRVKNNLGMVGLCLAGLPVLIGQTMVEHATISGAAATAAGSVKNVGSAISGALKNLDTTATSAAKKKRSAAGPQAASSPAAPSPATPSATLPKAVQTYEDPAGIKAGMSSAELVRRFGEASMTVTGESGEQTLYYSRKDGTGQMAVRVVDGQVVSVT